MEGSHLRNNRILDLRERRTGRSILRAIYNMSGHFSPIIGGVLVFRISSGDYIGTVTILCLSLPSGNYFGYRHIPPYLIMVSNSIDMHVRSVKCFVSASSGRQLAVFNDLN